MSDTEKSPYLPPELMNKILEDFIGEENGDYFTLSRPSPDFKVSGPKILSGLQLNRKLNFESKKILHKKKILRIRSDNITPVFVLKAICGFEFEQICFSHYSCIALLVWRPQWAGGDGDTNWAALNVHTEFLVEVAHVPRRVVEIAHAPRTDLGFGNIRLMDSVKESLCDSMEHLCKKMPTLNYLELGIDVLELLPNAQSFRDAVDKFLKTDPENYVLEEMGEITQNPWKTLHSHEKIEKVTICVVWKRFLEQRLLTGEFEFDPALTDMLRQQLQAKAKDLLSYFYCPHQYYGEKQKEMDTAAEASDAKGKGKSKGAPLLDALGHERNAGSRPGKFLKALECREATEVDDVPVRVSGAGEGDGVSQGGASAQQ